MIVFGAPVKLACFILAIIGYAFCGIFAYSGFCQERYGYVTLSALILAFILFPVQLWSVIS